MCAPFWAHTCLSYNYYVHLQTCNHSKNKASRTTEFNDFNLQGFKCAFFPSHWWRMKDLYVWNKDLLTNHIGVKKKHLQNPYLPLQKLGCFSQMPSMPSTDTCISAHPPVILSAFNPRSHDPKNLDFPEGQLSLHKSTRKLRQPLAIH